MKTYATKNVYLSSFLVSQDNFKLGKVYIADEDQAAGKATIEIEYDEKYEPTLNQYIKLYDEKKAVCRLNTYQENIRFIMHLVNTRKSGIDDEPIGEPKKCKKERQ